MVSNNYLDNKRSFESVNLENKMDHNVCVEDIHHVGPFKVWNVADRYSATFDF